ncbi:MAG: PspC domain-containing protein [Patiriisocius sp.]|uniref:PspC domain-containing protein n=1 Tax=Patiriisocius sp. TaxID=2822396 RepID=UPI003EF2A13F
MKKTVNINLAGTFFHIDEDAFGKLQRYLDAIRRSLSDPLGGEEIIRDIEARIAELFSEKIETNSQVVSTKELDEVIKIMGQPEDYTMGEASYEEDMADAPKDNQNYESKTRSPHKQLFRDIDNKFVSGVSSGLGHYLGLDAIWVRLLWILLTFLTSGTAILAYVLFWILVPAAQTTSEKLKMTGEPINISNIEKKFNEGYQNVADSIKNADYDKYGDKIRKGSSNFFDTLGTVIVTILKVFLKFFGVILMVVGLMSLVGIIIGLFAFGTFGIYDNGVGLDMWYLVDASNTPVWVISMLGIFAAGIPMLVLFILGLKIVAPNVKSIGTPAKITLLVLWLASLGVIAVLAIKQASARAYDNSAITEIAVPVNASEIFRVKMRADKQYSYEVNRHGGLKLRTNQSGERVIYSNDIRLIVRHTNDSVGKLIIERTAEAADFIEAKNYAEAIDYNYTLTGNELVLDGFFTTSMDNKFRDQEIEVVLYLPSGTQLMADKNTYSFHRNDSRYRDILNNGDEGKTLLITPNGTECLDCPTTSTNSRGNYYDYDQERSTGEYRNNSWEQEVEDGLNGTERELNNVDRILQEKEREIQRLKDSLEKGKNIKVNITTETY